MVCDIYKILDCGEKKNVPETIDMTAKDYHIWCQFDAKYPLSFEQKERFHEVKCLDNYIGIRNCDYRWKGRIRDFKFWEKEFQKLQYKSGGYDWRKIVDEMYKDLNIERFLHEYMINVSPNWKLPEGEKPTKLMISLLQSTIDGYLAEGDRWDSAEYVLENGSDGNFLHAHIVARPNRDIIRSVDTHMEHHNHSFQMRKRWDKLCKANPELVGYVGVLGGNKNKNSIQRIVLRNEELIADKKKYLVEAHKPEGHTNVPQDYLNTKRSWRREC